MQSIHDYNHFVKKRKSKRNATVIDRHGNGSVFQCTTNDLQNFIVCKWIYFSKTHDWTAWVRWCFLRWIKCKSQVICLFSVPLTCSPFFFAALSMSSCLLLIRHPPEMLHHFEIWGFWYWMGFGPFWVLIILLSLGAFGKRKKTFAAFYWFLYASYPTWCQWVQAESD